jgi:hypothetical protein
VEDEVALHAPRIDDQVVDGARAVAQAEDGRRAGVQSVGALARRVVHQKLAQELLDAQIVSSRLWAVVRHGVVLLRYPVGLRRRQFTARNQRTVG